MLFENGDQCWNGPKRSVEVEFVCGLEQKVMKVDEPSMCEYQVVIATSAVCPIKKIRDPNDL